MRSASPRPCRVTASTITASARTNRQNPGLASPTRRGRLRSRRRNRGAMQQHAATERRPGRCDVHRGRDDEARNGQAEHGERVPRRGDLVRAVVHRLGRQVAAEEQRAARATPRRTRAPTAAPSARRSVRTTARDAVNASRFVRFDTGSSNEPLFASRVHAYACGRAGTPSRAAVAQHNGCQQHDRRVQGEHGRHESRERDDERQQPARPPAAGAGGDRAEVVEDPRLRAQVAEHEDAGEESDRRPDRLQPVDGVVRTGRSRSQRPARRPAPRPRASLSPNGRATATYRLATRTATAIVSAGAPCTDAGYPRQPIPSLTRRTSRPGGRVGTFEMLGVPAEESPGSTGQGGCQQQPGVTRGTVPQKTDRRRRFRPVVGKGETVV